MVLNVHSKYVGVLRPVNRCCYIRAITSTETIRLIREGENGGKGVWRWGKRESIYLSLHCHHQNDLH